jgi:hypothetical protein
VQQQVKMSEAGAAAGECVRACALGMCIVCELRSGPVRAPQQMGSRVSTPTLQGRGPMARRRARLNASRVTHMRSWDSKVHKRMRQKTRNVPFTVNIVNILGHLVISLQAAAPPATAAWALSSADVRGAARAAGPLAADADAAAAGKSAMRTRRRHNFCKVRFIVTLNR